MMPETETEIVNLIREIRNEMDKCFDEVERRFDVVDRRLEEIGSEYGRVRAVIYQRTRPSI